MRKIGKMVSGAAVLLMLAAACGGKEGRGADFSEGKNRDIEVIDIDKAKREKALLYSSILEEPDVIVLETNPEYMKVISIFWMMKCLPCTYSGETVLF